ncbi:MAG: hypothetical protein IKI69_00585, partial [Oscillospiraceae bacterium]|nr:hypothetical protein [Oscillospiraceae bacterium]
MSETTQRGEFLFLLIEEHALFPACHPERRAAELLNDRIACGRQKRKLAKKFPFLHGLYAEGDSRPLSALSPCLSFPFRIALSTVSKGVLQNINFKKVFARKVTGNRQNRRFPVTILRYSFVTLAPKAHFATRP